MANKNQVMIDIIIDDKGTTKRVAMDADKLGIQLDKAAKSTEKGTKSTDKLSTSQKNLDRNMRGTAKMSGNTTKEFSKMSQGMGGLVGAYATLAAQVFAVSAAFQFLSSASDLRNLIDGQEALGAMTGVAYKTITNSIVEATDAQLKYTEAAKGVAIGTAAGLSATQLEKLGTAAKNTSFALGRDLTDSYNRLIRGATKAEPELLDELGIILRLEPATKKYALSIGKAVTDLTAFERTQAVTNEVLEQAEKKFGGIADQMDPAAAALGRFTKSFDELVNTFKIGLIDTVSPALQFLSKNTYALTAAMALFAAPILKAILPNLDEWANKQKMVYDEHAAHSENYKRDMISNAKQARQSQKIVQNAHKKSGDTARKTTQNMGTKGAAVDFITGDDKTNRGRGGAARMLSSAQKQMDKNGKITTGKLAGYNRQQLLDLQISYKHRVAASKVATTQILTMWQRLGTGIKAVAMGAQSAWSAAMSGMVLAARGAAIAINFAMGAIAILGVLALIVSAGVALFKWLFPATKEAQKQAKEVENLTDRYKTLSEEMTKAADGRESILSGASVIASEAASLQSMDIGKIVTDLNSFQKLDKDTKGYEEAKEQLKATFAVLERINPKFAVLNQTMDSGKKIGTSLSISLKKTAADIVKMGQAVSALPDLLKAAEVAMSDLGKSSIKITPLSSFVQAQTKGVDGLLNRQEAAKIGITKNNIVADKAERLRQEQNDNINEKFTDKQKRRLDGMSATARQFIFKNKGVKDLELDPDWRSKEEVSTIRTGSKEAFQGIIDDGMKMREMEEVLERAVKLETKIVENRIRGKEELIETIGNMTLGLTTQGKIVNLEMKRVKGRAKIRAAEEAIQAAAFHYDEAKEEQDAAKIQSAKNMLDLANMGLTLVTAEVELEERKTKLAEEQYEWVKKTQAVRRNQYSLEQMNVSDRAALSRTEANQAPTRENKANNRLEMGRILESEEIAAQGALELVRKNRGEAIRKILDSNEYDSLTYKSVLDDDPFGAGAATPSSTGVFDMEKYKANKAKKDVNDVQQFQGKISTATRTYSDAMNANTDAKAFGGEDGTFLTKQITMEREKLDIQAQGLVIGRGRQEAARLLAEYEAAGLTVSKEVIEKYDVEGQKIAEQKTMLEGIANIRNTIESSMTTALQGLIEGTKTAKQAFGDMAKSILSSIAQMITKLLVMKILGAGMFGGVFDSVLPKASVKDGGIPYPMAKGGYSLNKHNYSRGGMARGAQAGYAATLHGNEAVVPLPDNRSIPVTLNGAGGQNNNVVVNVSMDGQGGQSGGQAQGNSDQARSLGAMVANAVQQELQNQKRSGGILSPYGVA